MEVGRMPLTVMLSGLRWLPSVAPWEVTGTPRDGGGPLSTQHASITFCGLDGTGR